MTDKELLLKDLCARLPYGVICLADRDKTFDGGVVSKINVVDIKRDWIELESILTSFHLDETKPYLRPMSSMTEEERNEYNAYHSHPDNISDSPWFYVDWLNAHHFDYRGLIEKGLALEAPEGMYS